MAEVPDLTLCFSSGTSNAPFERSTDQNFANGRNLLMDTDDSLPVIATASASERNAVAQIAPSDAAVKTEYNFADNIPLLKRIEILKHHELLTVHKSDSNFYSTLIAYYFASFDWQKIRMCRMRIETLFNRENKELILLTKIARSLEEHQFGTALKMFKEWECKPSSLKELMFEVQERLQLYIMLVVQRSYTSIEIKPLAEMLDISTANLPQLMNRFGWSINAGFVYPVMSQELIRILEERQDSLFGEISLKDINESVNILSFRSFDEELEYLANFIALMET